MAQAEVTYGIIRLGDPSGVEANIRLEQPVNELLALRDKPGNAGDRIKALLAYGVFGLLGSSDRERAYNRIRRWRKERIPEAVLRAAKKASEGRLDPWLAPHLARVRFSQGSGADEIPDLLALVAWSIHRAALSDRYRVARCEWCGLPWFTAGRGRYCERDAPGSVQTCLQLGKMRDFRARQRKGKTDG
jgi:hypothetical protein